MAVDTDIFFNKDDVNLIGLGLGSNIDTHSLSNGIGPLDISFFDTIHPIFAIFNNFLNSLIYFINFYRLIKLINIMYT